MNHHVLFLNSVNVNVVQLAEGKSVGKQAPAMSIKAGSCWGVDYPYWQSALQNMILFELDPT